MNAGQCRPPCSEAMDADRSVTPSTAGTRRRLRHGRLGHDPPERDSILMTTITGYEVHDLRFRERQAERIELSPAVGSPPNDAPLS